MKDEIEQLREQLMCVEDALDYLQGLTPAQAVALRKDAERLSWLERHLFCKSWNGVIDGGSRTDWRVVGDFRHTTQKMVGHTFREAIDAAMQKTAKEHP
ncbi:hypothetical protein [Methylibium sp.]|uniref:hypothetical protein n=1 Tax=Methylibium sp. TaxID=2067992 RepID=UPI0017A2AF55|nr:hypothetical protein [Methylibium sp.]MBA3588224.1 hypothetical protein [Methylibium sp.]